MAVEVRRVVEFGPGSKSYEFEVYRNDEADRRIYETGRKLEQARFREGSLGQQMFDRLSIKTESTAKK